GSSKGATRRTSITSPTISSPSFARADDTGISWAGQGRRGRGVTLAGNADRAAGDLAHQQASNGLGVVSWRPPSPPTPATSMPRPTVTAAAPSPTAAARSNCSPPPLTPKSTAHHTGAQRLY